MRFYKRLRKFKSTAVRGCLLIIKHSAQVQHGDDAQERVEGVLSEYRKRYKISKLSAYAWLMHDAVASVYNALKINRLPHEKEKKDTDG